MIKQVLSAIGIFIVLAILGITFSLISRNSNTPTQAKIGDAVFKLEIADNPAAQTKGLSDRDDLDSDRGMLFIFPEEEIQKFWMKDMRFPIDIIWIKKDVVVGMVIGAEPEPGLNYTIYSSPEAVDKVLEINAGLTQKLGIKVGDLVGLK